MNRRAIGNEYEQLACDYLEKKGVIVLARNYHTRYSEIDIIAKDKDTYVFCEVKYRSSAKFGSPLDAVDIHKQRKICQGAMYYCTAKNIVDMPIRFDVIAIYGDSSIEHIENAFDYV